MLISKAVFFNFEGEPDRVLGETQANRLYHNRENGTFEDVSSKAGVQGDGISRCKGSNWIDYDNDDYPDLFSWGANPFQQTIGLARADRIAILKIHWPTSGTTQVFRDIAVDQAIEVAELTDKYRALNWKPIRPVKGPNDSSLTRHD